MQSRSWSTWQPNHGMFKTFFDIQAIARRECHQVKIVGGCVIAKARHVEVWLSAPSGMAGTAKKEFEGAQQEELVKSAACEEVKVAEAVTSPESSRQEESCDDNKNKDDQVSANDQDSNKITGTGDNSSQENHVNQRLEQSSHCLVH